LSSAISNVPDGMANGVLVGVNPVYGLYATMMGPGVGNIFAVDSGGLGIAIARHLGLAEYWKERSGAPSVHGGHAGHMPASGGRKALILSGLLTGGYFIVELGIGLWSGSVAVTSDAFHTFSAVGGVLIALVAQRFSERPATAEGFDLQEAIGALQSIDGVTDVHHVHVWS
jgi:hypothetical protein